MRAERLRCVLCIRPIPDFNCTPPLIRPGYAGPPSPRGKAFYKKEGTHSAYLLCCYLANQNILLRAIFLILSHLFSSHFFSFPNNSKNKFFCPYLFLSRSFFFLLIFSEHGAAHSGIRRSKKIGREILLFSSSFFSFLVSKLPGKIKIITRNKVKDIRNDLKLKGNC